MAEKIKSFIADPKVRMYASYAGAFLAGVVAGIGGMVAKDKLTPKE